MPAKVAAFIATFLINVTAGVVIFFFLLLAMNGFSESDAAYGLGVYIAIAIIVSLIMSSCAALLVHILIKRRFRGWTAVLIAVPVLSLAGAIFETCGGVVGVLIAEYVRKNY